MNQIESLLYVSLGNLPSKLASSIQVAKMSQALATKIEDFALVTSGDLFSSLKGMDAEFQTWYGLNLPYNLVRLPVHLKTDYPFDQNYSNKTYFKLAILYACLKHPSLVYSRSCKVVAPLLELGIPVLWERHELLPDPLLKESIYRKFFASKNLVGFVTLSPKIAENYIKNGLSPDKVLIAHSGVDPSLFLPYQSKATARQHLGLAKDAKIIVYTGHLYEHKGISTILATASQMKNCQFVLVGGWQADIDQLKDSCRQAQLDNVNVIGHVQQAKLATYVYAADVLLLPTSKHWKLAETTSPMKLFEYMSVKRPIVASALPNIMTVLRDRQNALLAEPDNQDSFRRAIAELLEQPDLALKLSEQAFNEVQQYTWDSRAKTILQFAQSQLTKMDNLYTDRHKTLLRCLKYVVST